MLVAVTEYLISSQSERQWPHWAWSVLVTSCRNLVLCQGSQVASMERAGRGRNHGRHPVLLAAWCREHSSWQLLKV